MQASGVFHRISSKFGKFYRPAVISALICLLVADVMQTKQSQSVGRLMYLMQRLLPILQREVQTHASRNASEKRADLLIN